MKYKMTVYETITDANEAGDREQRIAGDDDSLILHIGGGCKWKVTTNDIVNLYIYAFKEGVSAAQDGYDSVDVEYKSEYSD